MPEERVRPGRHGEVRPRSARHHRRADGPGRPGLTPPIRGLEPVPYGGGLGNRAIRRSWARREAGHPTQLRSAQPGPARSARRGRSVPNSSDPAHPRPGRRGHAARRVESEEFGTTDVDPDRGHPEKIVIADNAHYVSLWRAGGRTPPPTTALPERCVCHGSAFVWDRAGPSPLPRSSTGRLR